MFNLIKKPKPASCADHRTISNILVFIKMLWLILSKALFRSQQAGWILHFSSKTWATLSINLIIIIDWWSSCAIISIFISRNYFSFSRKKGTSLYLRSIPGNWEGVGRIEDEQKFARGTSKWSTPKTTHIQKITACHNRVLRTIVNALYYVR